MNIVYKSFLSTLPKVVIAAAISTGAAVFVNACHFAWLTQGLIVLIRILSATILTAAALGRPGWKVTTWDGESEDEKRDKKIYLVCQLIGFGLVVFAFVLLPAHELTSFPKQPSNGNPQSLSNRNDLIIH